MSLVTPRDLLQFSPNPAALTEATIRRVFRVGRCQAHDLKTLAMRAPAVLERQAYLTLSNFPDPMLTPDSKPIATVSDAIDAAEHALQRTPEGCPSLITPYALRLLTEAAKRDVARGSEAAERQR